MGKKVALHNLGCKVNAYETEAMQQLLEEAGYEIVPFEPGADIYVINTCTVTNIADRKSRQMLHKAKKMNPSAIVAAAGCYAQTDPQGLLEDGTVDLILGNNQKKNLVAVLREFQEKQDKSAHVIAISQTKEYEELSIRRTAGHTRAFIKVQDGCNQFCTYCIIPYARGRVRSRRVGDVLEEVGALAEAGYREVVLTGIHLSSYGRDFPEEEKETLLSLIQAVHQVGGIERIRLGSLEPGVITEEFVQGIYDLKKVCPHFHLSLQSGCDDTLRRMNRRYLSAEYREKCRLLRKYYGNPALTTDIIVGFPGESEEDFRISRDFVAEIHFYETHIFKYSRRKGTKAASMPGQLTEAVKEERSRELLELHERRAKEYERGLLGEKLEVLLEEKEEIDGNTWYVGHSREYVKVAVPSEEGRQVNEIVSVIAKSFLKDHILAGEEIEL